MMRVPALLLALALVGRAMLPADGFIVIPRPPRPGPGSHFPLEVVRHDVRVEIESEVATTTVDQEFYNPNSSRLEGHYLFPLPANAVIKKFSMWIDGRETQAELLDAGKARGIYEDIVRQMRDPALLEYNGRGVFRMRVFPIEPRRRKRIMISYHEVLEKSNGAVAYLYPLGTEKFSARAIPEVRIELNIHSAQPLAAIHCPTHPVTIARPAPGRATVSYSARDTLPNGDFRLFFTPAAGRFGFSMLTFRPAGQEGTFFLSLAPNFAGDRDDVSGRDIVFAVDTSGSMTGRAMEQARQAIQYCLGRLNRNDRFNVIRFSTEAESLFQGVVPASEAMRRQAREFVAAWEAAGGTNCAEALDMALKEGPAGDRARVIVLITDGRPTIGETGEEALLRRIVGDRHGGVRGLGARQGNVRIFPVAIGSEINIHLLDRIAEETRTFRTYIGAGEDIQDGISRFYDKIGSPLLSDVRLDVSANVHAAQMHPREMPDLYKGSALTVTGRYRGSGQATIVLSGRVNGRREEFTFKADFPAESADFDFLPPLWAARRVGFLLDQIRLHGENLELRDEVIRLAREYGIVTPYTSYLIVEDEQARRDRGELAANELTLAGGAAAAPAAARRHREEFKAMSEKSGTDSVRASKVLQKLNQAEGMADMQGSGDPLRQQAQQTRIIQGQAFYLSGGAWVDARVQGKSRQQPLRVAFASDAYFSLLKKQPELAPVLAQGRNLRFVSKGQVIEVYDPEGKGS
jgi:Ca-activated chloride channel family protein